jgi:CIC family chloride channel protein
VAFNKSLLAAQRGMDWVRADWRWMMPGAAGVAAGLLGWWYPDAIGGGHAVAERLLTEKFDVAIAGLATLLVLKFAMTVFSYSSGAPGGIFAPMLLMGAVLGALVGQIGGWLVPAWRGDTAAFSVLGMAAFFASSVRAPLTGIVLILEMTANQEQLFALCVTCLISYLVAERLRDRPIYEALLEADLMRRGIGDPGPEPTVVVIGIHHGAAVEGKRIRQAGFPEGCLVVEVERAGRELLPYADLELAAGDHIKVLTPGQTPEMALEVVRMCTLA